MQDHVEKPQTILVTGGNRGIGLEIVKAALQQKTPHKVFIGCRNPHGALALVATLVETFGPRVETVELDVTKQESIEQAVKVVETAGGLDILVNNAGVLLEADGAIFTMEAARQTLSVNFEGVVAVTQAFMPLLERSHGTPQIAFTSSSQGARTLGLLQDEHRKALMEDALSLSKLQDTLVELISGLSNPSSSYHSIPTVAYGISKMGVNCYTQILARQHPAVQTNSCSPGFCNTDMCANYKGERKPKEPALGASVFTKVLFGELGHGKTGRFFKESSKAGTTIAESVAAEDAWVLFPDH